MKFVYKVSALIFISLIFLLAIFSFSCEKRKLINEEKFVEVYAKLTLLKETYRNDQAKFIEEREKLFKEYKIKKEELQATINHYNEDPERWKVFFEKVIKYLDELKENSNQK